MADSVGSQSEPSATVDLKVETPGGIGEPPGELISRFIQEYDRGSFDACSGFGLDQGSQDRLGSSRGRVNPESDEE